MSGVSPSDSRGRSASKLRADPRFGVDCRTPATRRRCGRIKPGHVRHGSMWSACHVVLRAGRVVAVRRTPRRFACAADAARSQHRAHRAARPHACAPATVREAPHADEHVVRCGRSAVLHLVCHVRRPPRAHGDYRGRGGGAMQAAAQRPAGPCSTRSGASARANGPPARAGRCSCWSSRCQSGIDPREA